MSSVAFVDDQFRVAASPLWMKLCDACNVTVGRAGGGGAGAGAGGGGGATTSFLQAPANSRRATRVNRNTGFRVERISISESSLRNLACFVG
jgi:hypothetical protein